MLFRPFFTALFVLLFSLATCATIDVRSGPSLDIDKTLEPTEPIPLSIPQTPAAILRRAKRHDTNDQTSTVHETIDWREDQALKLESEREAGFRPGSHDDVYDDDDDKYPLPAFWPLFKICVVSAIAIFILKLIRDLRG